MTQPIKFRGFRVDNNEPVYGSLVQFTESILSIFVLKNGGHDVFHIHPSSLGMFTGRTDKNEREIYGAIGEKGGDRIKDFQGHIFTCIFNGIRFDMIDSDGCSRSVYYHQPDVFWLSSDEIIGNQWEVDNGK